MDKVLIADNDQQNLNKLKEGLNKLNQFEVLIASDGKEALEILGHENVSVFIMDINISKIDGLELLAYMTVNHYSTPCIVMTEYGKPWFKQRKGQQDFLYHIEKPFEIDVLFSAIFVGLNLRDEGQALRGMSVKSFLPLIEMTQKTCRVEVDSSGKGKGYFYFDDGILIDAHHNKLRREKAALAMAGWDKIKIKITDLPKRRTNRRVKSELMSLLRASWSYDELEPTDKESGDSGDYSKDLELYGEEEVEKIITEKDDLEIALKPHIDKLRFINGYKAVGIMDRNGVILTHDAIDENIDIISFVDTFTNIYQSTNKFLIDKGLDECLSLIVHAKKETFLHLCSGAGMKNHFHIIVVMSSGGNWYFMLHQLEKMIEEVSNRH